MKYRSTIALNRILLCGLLLGAMSSGYAQEEFNSKSKVVPAKEKPVKPRVVGKPIPDPPKIKPYVADPIPKNDFKMPKSEAIVATEVYRRDQDLGIYKSASSTAKVRFRDGAYLDGDKIRVTFNDIVVDYDALLDGTYKEFEVKLVKGVNRIVFEALNEGFAPPNTAEFQVFDDKGALILSNQWNIGTGYIATIIIEKP
ncbi:MAG: hypothetical protein P8M54_06685 [Flavobacterium sp.]|nr:hypothetical protein [Flavobacterium sp.]MDG2432130.1 hypothetical protein [Flavobacterium sp.]